MSDRLFVTAINCIDGRVQLPVIHYMQKEYGADFVDNITIPGPEKHISMKDMNLVERIKERIWISANAHHSKMLAIVGHSDCTANPITDDEHKHEIKMLVEEVKTWGLPMEIVGLFVDSSWNVQPVV